MPSNLQIFLAAIGVLIGLGQLIPARWITEQESNHPAYKLEKVVWGAVFLGTAAATLLTGQIRDGFRLFTSALIVVSTVAAFVFIRYRKNNPLYHMIRLRTQRGLVLSGDIDENNLTASKAAALYRHHRAGGGQPLLSEWAILEMEQAVGVRPVSQWVADEYDKLDLRREARARSSGSTDQ
jgi:hypothetical protein